MKYIILTYNEYLNHSNKLLTIIYTSKIQSALFTVQNIQNKLITFK